MKKLILILVVMTGVGGGAGAIFMRRDAKQPDVRTADITRGDIVDAVAATGTLEAVTTVEVGTQVGGVVQELYADFNSIVKKGQVIARLDPSLLQTQIEQQRANVVRAEADLERLKIAQQDAEQKLERARTLFEKNLLPRTDLENAEVAVQSSGAQIRSSEAALSQARSQLKTADVNLGHTVIRAPIDGIVISRQVEPGQTVNAGMSAPTLFILAADLSKMRLKASIDEADVGRMRPGQQVTFRVDAFPRDVFRGEVEQVRLQPTTVQNVVSYQTVINVPNAELKLKPGMTANANIEVSRKNDVLRIPTAATRFRPTSDVFAALHQEVPAELQRAGGQRNGGRQAMSPDARPAVNQNVPRPNAQQGRVASTPRIAATATTIDALFGPLPAVETRGRAWIYVDKQLKSVPVRLGITDGTYTEILESTDLDAGKQVVTNVTLPTAATATTPGNAQNPLMGPQRGGPGGRGRGF